MPDRDGQAEVSGKAFQSVGVVQHKEYRTGVMQGQPSLEREFPTNAGRVAHGQRERVHVGADALIGAGCMMRAVR